MPRGNKVKVIVFGSVGYGGFEDIKAFYTFLEAQGYEPIKHIEADGMDYTNVNDFRSEKELSQKITTHDLEYIKPADCVVALAAKPSWGTAMELYEAKRQGKLTITYAENEIPTPWPISFADFIATNRQELIACLRSCEEKISNSNTKQKSTV